MLENFFALLGLTNDPVGIPPLEILEIHAAPHLAEFSQPIVHAETAIVMDLGSGRILFAKNAEEKRAVASLTKLMTAIVVRENYDLNEIVTVSAEAAAQPPAKIWLTTGEQISVENLLKALLIESANDAAIALAEKMGLEKFVEKMNGKVVALGLKNTNFENPVGYDAVENFSTAHDLATLAGYFLRDEILREITKTPKAGIAATNGIVHELYSTNNLFGTYLDIRGLKTGRTEDAGEC
ncbi:D-alanyl-D-alanine carboxypeptidase, partial [Candidatus Gracilibacteria bacterium]|nr:D-alanyl-D-alanine carboxypeptidase [Candidatus Gracilibacteria bacterium]